MEEERDWGSERGLKVLMISKALVVGAYHAKLRELVQLGVDLTVVVPPTWGDQALETVPPDGYKLLVKRCTFSGNPHVHFYPGMSEVIEQGNWDLVHIDEEAFLAVTHQALRACERAGKRAVFFAWQNISKIYPPPFNYFERFAYRHAAGAIAGNAEVRGILRARNFLGPIEVIPQFGVDETFFRKREFSELRNRLGLADKFVIGYVGRVVKEKGIADLLHALALLPEACVLVLVGSGEFEAVAKNLARDLGLGSRIQWVPRIASLEVPDAMNAFDALVLPSRTTPRWKEQFGRVLIEAMACETPVVGSDSGEIPHVIGDGGLLFAEGEAQMLAERLLFLYENVQARTEMGAMGRRRVMERFTHREIAQRTVLFYGALASAESGRRPA